MDTAKIIALRGPKTGSPGSGTAPLWTRTDAAITIMAIASQREAR